MSRIIRVSDEVYEWIRSRSQHDGTSASEVIDAFSQQDWQILDIYILYAARIGIIPEPTLGAWIREASNLLAREVKDYELKRKGFK